MNVYFVALYCGALCTVTAQLILKKGAQKRRPDSLIEVCTNYYSLLGYFLLVISLVLGVFAMREVALSYLVVIQPLIQISVVMFSAMLFQEKLSSGKIQGISLIVLGIAVFNYGIIS